MTEPSADVVLVRDHGAVRVLTMNRPEVRNAFNVELYTGLAAALQAAKDDDGIKVVVLTGAGKVFSSGQDLEEMAALAAGNGPEGAASGFPTLLDTVQDFDKPLIAAVNGAGVGLGFTLLGHVDLVLVSETARFKVPFAELVSRRRPAAATCCPSGSGRRSRRTSCWPTRGCPRTTPSRAGSRCGCARPTPCSTRRWSSRPAWRRRRSSRCGRSSA